MLDPGPAEEQTRRWLDEFVVGLNLCPFARPLLTSPQLRIVTCPAADPSALQHFFLSELDRVQSSPESEIATSLLVFTTALADFEDYLDFLGLAHDLLGESGLEGVIQLASFHPDYQFEGEPANAASHFSNRSPWPTIHLIREDMLERVLLDYPDPAGIPGRNVERLEALGPAELQLRWNALFDPQTHLGSE
ncbi:DUF1415 domain-containing protein [Seongchinamella unica]|uniref:DUF1415 domain-containing protein n=1 Tax=Seongchinamella unica TaxID=2547392 RepID=A0A4R5LW89_9GAMM|nr:DUF1415 domain-containing protein [Seongchinamella unica]TDG15713.1 DUF1415 domain-containing protein [Seongchinamella unica]